MNTPKTHAQRILKSQQGLSLIEILIALSLLALAGTFIGGRVLQSFEEGKQTATIIQMQNLSNRLKEFRRHCGRYPTTDQGLISLIEKPEGGRDCPKYQDGGYLDKDEIPLDGWDQDFEYQSDGNRFKIISLGADGIEGGEGFDRDLDSDKDA